MQIIIFTLSDEYYAINTENVDEISKNIRVANVPNAPDWIEGLINLRGNVVTLINSYKLLEHKGNMVYNDIIIVHNDNGEKIGIMVKDIIEVANIEESDIQKVSDITENGVMGIIDRNDSIVNIIDINELISKNEITMNEG